MTKEQVYEYIKANPKKPFHLREVARGLGLSKDKAKNALEELVAEGKLIRTRRKTYGLPEKMNLVVGKLQIHSGGFAFVLVEDGEDLFIPPGKLAGAWPMDKVVARILPTRPGGKTSGEVIRILERAKQKLVGTLEFARGYAILRPDDKRYPERLLLSPEGLEDLREGARIAVVVHYPEDTGEKEPFGVLHEYLGQGETPETETRAVIQNFDLRETFPAEALAEAERIPRKIPAPTRKSREDFRELPVFTIDGADAKDFDDAIHLERLEGGGYRVGIHIADVAHYVREGSALDREAYERATSVYLPGRVLPMLPEKISNGVCSLVPGEDRLTMSVVADLDEKGRVRDYRIVQGVIRSRARLTYGQVEELLSGGRLPEEARFLEDGVRELYRLTRHLKAERLAAGALDFDTREVKVDFDEGGNLHLIPIREGEARSLIEELMLLANRLVARHLDERGIPTLYRVHEDPVADRYKTLVEALGRMGYHLPAADPDPASMQRVLEAARGKPEGPAVSMLVLRSMSLARYAHENLGHFGLAFEDYLHFTSPIRRYPDLVVHRVLKELIKGKGRIGPKKKAAWTEKFPRVAEHASERERAAEKAERDLTKYFQVKWAEAQVGKTFEGTVSGVTNFGLFVAIENGVEGLLPLSDLSDDYYEFVPEGLELVGRSTGKRWRLGDAIKVRIERATPALRQIDLAIEEEKMSASEKKPTKKKARSPRPAEGKKSGKAPRVLAGPPQEKARNDRPPRLTAQKVYFGEWIGEAEGEEKPRSKTRGRRKK
ncbi:ribonuclease R [Deinococcota bacterium DY0809b]